MSSTYLLERALLPDGVHDDVVVTVEDGRFTRVTPGGAAGGDRGDTEGAERLPGLAVPGLANTHSHAFHRALRGRTQRERGTFWTWREQMYDLAGRLDPESYQDLARATYREMAAAGMTTVGEFHYLHHRPDGTAYSDPNAMSHALIEAAREAGIRIALLDTCYLSSGFGAPPEGVQARYDDGSADAWAARVDALGPQPDGVVVGAAIHSVRAVPADQLGTVAAWAGGEAPLHVHLSEQRAENEACLDHHGVTPTRLLADHGVLGPMTTAVHATHLTDEDIALLGGSRTVAGFCPTTERDLGDGVGPSRRLHEAGSPISLGSDSHAVVDPFEEMRALETDERLATEQRGHWTAEELVRAATRHDTLGFADAGRIEPGARADLVLLDPASPRTAGTGADAHTAAFAATAADVTVTMVDGRVVFRSGDREEVGHELDRAIGRLWT
mgnify:CR=1 FL=1